MSDRLTAFLSNIAARDAYAEPRSEGHDAITEKVGPQIAMLLNPGARILDVGCGQGPALDHFGKAGFDATGITLNRDDIYACAEKGYKMILCDQNFMFEGWTGAFDCVWARHILEHSIAPFFTLHEFNRVLKPAGLLYAEMPCPDTDSIHEANPNHYSVLGHNMWLALLQRSGFDCIDAKELNMTTAAGSDRYWSFTCRKI